MGGKTVMNFAVRKPQLVDAVIVVDIAPKFYPAHHEAYISAMKRVDFTAAKSRRDIEAVLSQTLTSPGIIQFFMKASIGKPRKNWLGVSISMYSSVN